MDIAEDSTKDIAEVLLSCTSILYDGNAYDCYRRRLEVEKEFYDNLLVLFSLHEIYYKIDESPASLLDSYTKSVDIYYMHELEKHTVPSTEDIATKVKEAFNINTKNGKLDEKEREPKKLLEIQKEFEKQEELDKYYSPKLIKDSFTKNYKNYTIIKLELDNNKDNIQHIIESLFLCTEQSISFVNKGKYYFIKIESITKLFLFNALCSNNNIKIFYEYAFQKTNQKNLGRIFIERGLKPIYLEPYLKKHPISIFEQETTNNESKRTKIEVKYYSHKFSLDDFNPIAKSISFTIDNSDIIDNHPKLEILNVPFKLGLSEFYQYRLKTIFQLKKQKEILNKKLVQIDNQINSIEREEYNKNQYSIYFIDPKDIELEELFIYFHTVVDIMKNDNIKIYSSNDGLHFIKCPIFLVPNFINDFYIEDANYSTKNIEVFVPRGQCLFPIISKEFFYKALEKACEETNKKIILDEYFVLCDNRQKYFSPQDFVIVNKASGINLGDYIKNKKTNYLIADIFGIEEDDDKIGILHKQRIDLEKNNYDLNKQITEFDTSITTDVSEYLSEIILQWEVNLEEVENINKEVNKQFEDLNGINGIFKSFSDSWSDFFENEDLFEKANEGYRLIEGQNRRLEDKVVDFENQYKNLKKNFDDQKDKLEELKQSLSENKEEFIGNSKTSKESIENDSNEIESSLKALRKIEDDLKTLFEDEFKHNEK